MLRSGYNNVQEDNVFSFYSTGTKGIIVMAVKFTIIENNVYNLALGWFNEDIKDFDYDNLLGNGDGLRIFQTVADCIIKFLNDDPESSVHVEGNWWKKTTNYCKLITRNIEAIKKDYRVSALNGNTKKWTDFAGECDKYIAFRAKRK